MCVSLSRLGSINEYLASAGGGKTTGCSICLWGPGGTSGTHTTVGVTVGAHRSTWPGSQEHLARLQETVSTGPEIPA